MSERSARRRSKRNSLARVILGWAEGRRRKPLAFFVAGLGLGIVIGVALAVHHGALPTNQVASLPGSATPPKLAPSVTAPLPVGPATLPAAPATQPAALAPL